MGYRSEVGAVFSVDEWHGEPEDIAKHKLKYKEMIGLIKLSRFYELMNQSTEDKQCIGWRAGAFYFHAENWKWYPDYDVVEAWDELWTQMQEVEGISGRFLRVGEEVEDIVSEEFGEYPDYDACYPYSGMSWDVPVEAFGSGDIDGEFENLTLLDKDTRRNDMTDRSCLHKIFALIHPDTTPDGNKVSDGELLDMIYEILETQLKQGMTI
jgi:hypothetical protein